MKEISLAEGALAGDRRAMARLISLVENNPRGAIDNLRQIYPRTGKTHVIGITGPPGSGKSTLTDKLTKELRRAGKTVGIIAVDPTSPFSGGAILGDRVRMGEIAADPGVYIRSMATRGTLGGLSRATHDAVAILDACGLNTVIVETVGVGQSEVDIAKTADTTLVVLVPGLGDDIQSIKAGILEIADIFVINKADRPGAEQLAAELAVMLKLSENATSLPGWRPPILKTTAISGDGVPVLAGEIERHFHLARLGGQLSSRRSRRHQELIESIVAGNLREMLWEYWGGPQGFARRLAEVAGQEQDPYAAAAKLLEPVPHFGKGGRQIEHNKD